MAGGLLDFAKTPMGMGLLSAAFGGLAGANRDTPWNNLGKAGLAGIAGYSAADALQQKQVELDKAKAIQDAIPTLYKTDTSGNTTFDTIGGAKIGIDPATLKQYAELPNAGRAKVARTVTVPGANGQKVTVQLDDYGQKVGEGIDSYVAPQLVDMGDRKQFVTPQAGQTFSVGMSPAERDASARGWANVDVRKENNNILKAGVDLQEKAQRTQVITMPDGTIQLIDKATGQAVQPQTPEGKPLPKSPANLTEGEGKASIYLSQMLDASRALSQLPDVDPVKVGATGTTWTNWAANADAQRVAQAQNQWSEAFLRAKTGAAATEEEKAMNIRTFFPVVGDTPEVIKSKAAARAQAEQDMRMPAGRGAEQIREVPQVGAPAAPAGQQPQPVTGKFLGFE